MKYCTAAVGMAIICFFSPICSADDRPTMTVSIGTAKQDSPVQIVDLRRPEEIAGDPLILLRNNTDKQTLRVWVETLTRTAGGRLLSTNSPGPCGYISSTSSAPNCRFREERMIPPRRDVWAHDETLQSSHLLVSMNQGDFNCLYVATTVMHVDFADGTSWKRDDAQIGEALKTLDRLQGEHRCEGIRGREHELEQFESVAYPFTNASRYPDPSPVESFTFSCSFGRKRGRLVALCPL